MRGFRGSIRVIWAICLVGADTTHWLTLIRHGLFWDYGGVPGWLAAFWTALTFFDPVAAALLFIKPRVGVVMTVAIMIVDVAVNGWFVAIYGGLDWKLGSQAIFLVLVLITGRMVWSGGADVSGRNCMVGSRRQRRTADLPRWP